MTHSPLLRFGSDGVDQFSVPAIRTATRFGEVFRLPLRSGNGNTRSLGVLWDDRCPLVEGFGNCYSYLVRFPVAGEAAGNHYHREKDEIFTSAAGSFRVVLGDRDSGEREELALEEGYGLFVYVPRLVVHAVQALTPGAVLVALASHPNLDADSFRHVLVS